MRRSAGKEMGWCRRDPDLLANQLLRIFEGAKIHTVYEAGFSGFRLHRVLSKVGIQKTVVSPAMVEFAAGNKVKTDVRDARMLAEQLSFGKLKGIYIPTEKQEAARALSRGRQRVINRKQRICNQIKRRLPLSQLEREAVTS